MFTTGVFGSSLLHVIRKGQEYLVEPATEFGSDLWKTSINGVAVILKTSDLDFEVPVQ